jgi:hypothetical protein
MSMQEKRWIHRLREQPPTWPRRGNRRAPGLQRWLREPEPFEDRGAFEPYPGATVLQDLDTTRDEAGSLRILCRYTAVRVLLLATADRITGPDLRMECRVARGHLSLLPPHDWERRVLERLCEVCSVVPAGAAVEAAIIAAEAAAKRNHRMGAFALYRAAYEVARDRSGWPDAARAAAGIARLTHHAEAHHSTRVWRWRVGVLERRARRDDERKRARQAEAPRDEP